MLYKYLFWICVLGNITLEKDQLSAKVMLDSETLNLEDAEAHSVGFWWELDDTSVYNELEPSNSEK